MFPCAYILLTEKDTNLYKLVIRNLIKVGLENKLILRPEEIHSGGDHDFWPLFLKRFNFRLFFPFRTVFVYKYVLAWYENELYDRRCIENLVQIFNSLALIPTRNIQDEFVDLLEKAQGKINIKKYIFKYFLNIYSR